MTDIKKHCFSNLYSYNGTNLPHLTMSIGTMNSSVVGDIAEAPSRVTADDLLRQIEERGRQEKNETPKLTSEINEIMASLRAQVPQVLSDPNWKAVARFRKEIGKIGHNAQHLRKSDGKEERQLSARDKIYTVDNRRRMLEEARLKQKGNLTY